MVGEEEPVSLLWSPSPLAAAESRVHLDRDLLSISLSAFVTSDAGCHSKAIHLIFMHSVCRVRAGVYPRCNAESSWVVLCVAAFVTPKRHPPSHPPQCFPPNFLFTAASFFFFSFLFVELIWGRGYANKNMSVFICWLNSTIAMGNRLLKVIK